MEKIERKEPALRFPGFTDEWEQRKVGEVITEVSRPIEMHNDQLYQLVTVKRRNEGIVSRGFFYGKDILVKNYYEIHKGDYLISKRQLVHGANGLVPSTLDNAIVSNEYMVCVGNETLSAEFLTLLSKTKRLKRDFFLSSYGVDIEKFVFNVNDWKKRSLFLPTMPEQNTLCDFFKNLDDLIILNQQKLDQMKEYKSGMLQKMFPKDGETVPEVRFPGFTGDWEQRKLGDVAQITMGQSPDGSTYSNTPSTYILVQGNADLKDGWVSPRIWTTQKTKTADAGDLIMSVRAPAGAMGKTAYDVVLGRGVAGIKGNEFLYQTLIKMDESGYWKKLAEGSTFESINSDVVNNAEIMVPQDIDEQNRIGDYLSILDNLITLHQRKLEQMKEYKKGLLQQMFV